MTWPDPLIAAVRFLESQLEWLRHASDEQGGPYAVAVFDEIAQCAGRMRWLVDGPPAQKYLGPCGATLCALCGVVEAHHVCEGDIPVWTCDGDVYVREGSQRGRCRTCGAEVNVDERRIWLQKQVRSSDLAWTARGIADALGVNVKTLRAWATDRYSGDVLIRQAKLSTYWRDGERLVPWVEPPEGVRRERLHYVADVVELATQAAVQRAEGEARRERQHADVAG